jgi:hypothetical protein
VFVAFVCLGHIPDPTVVLDQCKPLVWSLPINDGSQFHVRPYGVQEIETMMGGVDRYQYADGDTDDYRAVDWESEDWITHALGVWE